MKSDNNFKKVYGSDHNPPDHKSEIKNKLSHMRMIGNLAELYLIRPFNVLIGSDSKKKKENDSFTGNH